MRDPFEGEDSSLYTVQLRHSSGKVRTLSFDSFVSAIAKRLQESTVETPRSEEIEILSIITSQSVTLSIRVRMKGSLDLEIDNDGCPVYIEFPGNLLNVILVCTYLGRKRTMSTLSNTNIILPFSNEGAKSIQMEVSYDGKNVRISASLS